MIAASSGFPLSSIAVTLALVVANGFFVAAELSLLAARSDRLQPAADEGGFGSRLALRSTAELGTMLAGSQLGVTIASIGLGAVAEPGVAVALDRLVGGAPDGAARPVSMAVALAVVVLLHVLLGEMLPKALALAAPERTLTIVAAPARAFVTVFRPVIWALAALARGGTRLLGVEPADELRSAHTAAEIGVMLAASRDEGLLEAEETELLTGALAFVGRRVEDVMVPIGSVVSVDVDDPLVAVEERFRHSGHSRLVVRNADGRMFGYVHVKDVLALGAGSRWGPLPRSVLRLTFSVEADAELGPLLVRMRAARRHLALVVDAERQTIGMVTLEDVVESIVGDITDETDVPTPD